MGFIKDIHDINSLPVIETNLYSKLTEELLWYDGPVTFFAEYEGREVYLIALNADGLYKVFDLTEKGRASVLDDHVPDHSKGEEWWDFLADEDCIGVWYL